MKTAPRLNWQALADHLGESIATTRVLCALAALLAAGSALLLAGPVQPLLGDEIHAGSAEVLRALVALVGVLSGGGLLAALALLGGIERLAPSRLPRLAVDPA